MRLGAETVLGPFGKYFRHSKLTLFHQKRKEPGETLLTIKAMSFWLDSKWSNPAKKCIGRGGSRESLTWCACARYLNMLWKADIQSNLQVKDPAFKEFRWIIIDYLAPFLIRFHCMVRNSYRWELLWTTFTSCCWPMLPLPAHAWWLFNSEVFPVMLYKKGFDMKGWPFILNKSSEAWKAEGKS